MTYFLVFIGVLAFKLFDCKITGHAPCAQLQDLLCRPGKLPPVRWDDCSSTNARRHTRKAQRYGFSVKKQMIWNQKFPALTLAFMHKHRLRRPAVLPQTRWGTFHPREAARWSPLVLKGRSYGPRLNAFTSWDDARANWKRIATDNSRYPNHFLWTRYPPVGAAERAVRSSTLRYG